MQLAEWPSDEFQNQFDTYGNRDAMQVKIMCRAGFLRVSHNQFRYTMGKSSMIKFIIGLIGLGYLVLTALRYFRILSGETNPQASGETDIAQREERYCKILDLRGKVTDEDIKKAYRARIAEYHPDKVQRMAPEIRDLAQKRTAELTEAYAYFKEKYRFN